MKVLRVYDLIIFSKCIKQLEMKTPYRANLRNTCLCVLFIGLCASGLPEAKKNNFMQFTFDSIMDVALPIIQPIVAAGSNKCEALKNLLGLTYEQMQEKNKDFQEMLHIDYITANGSVKYNLTAIKRLTKIMKTNKTVVILIHGFMESSDGLMVSAIAPEFLKKTKEYKVLAFDGGNLISMEYFRSSTYARFMGEKLGNLLAEVIKHGVDPRNLKLIGHSLGAHIAGITGKQVQRNIGERIGSITALDPAGPCFTDINPAARLHKGDALHIDVIHTNGGILGLKEPVGDKDFFPNGGWKQPGCLLSTCDHSRAWEIYSESIGNIYRFPARKCENWTIFTQGRCTRNEVAYIGPRVEAEYFGNYFLVTAPISPYGLGPSGSG